MDDFFKNTFRNPYMDDVANDSAPFHNLFNGVKTGGQVTVVFLSYVAVFVSMTLMAVYFFQLFSKDDKAKRNETKTKIVNGIIIFIALMATGWAVISTINLFAW